MLLGPVGRLERLMGWGEDLSLIHLCVFILVIFVVYLEEQY